MEPGSGSPLAGKGWEEESELWRQSTQAKASLKASTDLFTHKEPWQGIWAAPRQIGMRF